MSHSPFSDLRAVCDDYQSLWSFARQYTGLTGALLLISGLCFSPVLMTCGVVFIGFQAVFSEGWADLRKALRQQPLFWLMAAYYLAPLTALFHTQHLPEWLTQQQTVLPLLVVPFGMLAKPIYQPRQQRLVVDALVVVVFITGLATFGFYLANYQEMNEKLSRSQDIPIITGLNHIYFSIIAAFAAVAGGLRLFQQKQLASWWWIALLLMTLANILFLHVFTTRTGLGGFYLASGGLLLIALIRRRAYLAALGGVSALAGVGIMAILLLPPLQEQYSETKEDLLVYYHDENPNYYSLTTRLQAWEVSWSIIEKQPFVGVGPGAFTTAMDSAYEREGTLLLPENRINPHNQYLQAWGQAGLIGLIPLLGTVGWPLYCWLRKDQFSMVGLGLLAIIGFACLTEAMLERQAGATFMSFFWPWIGYQLSQGRSEPLYDEEDESSRSS
jgi:O-antigen ligase